MDEVGVELFVVVVDALLEVEEVVAIGSIGRGWGRG